MKRFVWVSFLFIVPNLYVHAQQSENKNIGGLHPHQRLVNMYIPTLEQMKYKNLSVSYGFGFWVSAKDDDELLIGRTMDSFISGTVTSVVSFPYIIANRVSFQLSFGFLLNAASGVSGLLGVGANTRLWDWTIIKEERENAILLRLAVGNDLMFTPFVKYSRDGTETSFISRLKHQINLELLAYKRNQSVFMGLGFITSPTQNFSYQNGAIVIEMGYRISTAHLKGMIFERKPSETSKVILPDNNY